MLQNRNDLIFTVVYSIHIENMMNTLLSRVDKLLVFLQIFLGIAVVANSSPVATGLAISILAIIQFIWQPGIKSGEAKASHDRWLALYNARDKLNDKELREEIRLISERDGFALSSIKLAAQIAACRQLDLSQEKIPEMTCWQKIISNIAGAII